MLFYVALIVASLITAVVIPLLYFIFKGAGTVISETVDLSRDSGFRREAKTSQKPTNYALKPAPMGVVSRETRAILASANIGQPKATHQPVKKKPDFRPRTAQAAPPKTTVQGAWLRHEARHTEVGTSYKVSRRVRVKN